MSHYKDVVIETYLNTHGGSSNIIRAHPLPGQGLNTSTNVSCSTKMRNSHNVGTKFLIKVKITDREGGTPYLYAHHNSQYQVLDDKEANEFIKNA